MAIPAEQSIDQFGVALLSVSTDGRILEWNRAAERILGFTRAEAVGASLFDLTVPDSVGDEVAARMWGARPGEATTYESIRRRKDGALVDVEITMRAVPGADGSVASLAVVLRDITDQRRRRESDRALEEEELDAVNYAVAHDLKAPLRGITGFMTALVEDHTAELSADARDYVERVRRNAERMGSMMEDLLALGAAARQPLRRERVDLAAVVREVFARRGVNEPAREVELVAPTHLWVSADARLSRTLVEQLVDNAWKFTAPVAAGRVELGARDSDGVPMFFVRDNGVGFPMEYAAKLFRPFQRLHGAKEFHGAGIGLAIARRIVHRHGGRISIDAAENAGATVHFTLSAAGACSG